MMATLLWLWVSVLGTGLQVTLTVPRILHGQVTMQGVF